MYIPYEPCDDCKQKECDKCGYKNLQINYERAMYQTRCYLMNPENQFKKNSKEHKQIIAEVLRLWRIYAPTVDMDNWGDPKVSIQYELKEQWENGEATYYWTAYDKCITQ